MSSSTRPNLFSYATSELSQDAMICWLLDWANPAFRDVDEHLHKCGQTLLGEFFRRHLLLLPPIQKIETTRQSDNIDVLCVINDEYAVLIEDKIGTREHSEQLPRYVQTLLQRGFTREKIVPIYFKTHEQSGYSSVEKHGYKVFTRSALLEVLRGCESNNAILHDFRHSIEHLDSRFQSFKNLPLSEWHWHSWIGFYQELQKQLGIVDDCWGYVANPAGGFLAFTWCWLHDNEFGCEVYLQLEEEKLCFKVGEVEPDDQVAVRSNWHRLITSNAKAHGLNVVKPRRFGAGTYMTFAVLSEEYRKSTADGLLDVERTVELIKTVTNGLRAIFESNAEQYSVSDERRRNAEQRNKLRDLGSLLFGGNPPPGVQQWYIDGFLIHDFTTNGTHYGVHTAIDNNGWFNEVFCRTAPKGHIIAHEEVPTECFSPLATSGGTLERGSRGYVVGRLPVTESNECVARSVEKLISRMSLGKPPSSSSVD